MSKDIKIAVGVLDSRFLMGSMGTVVGEKIALLAEYAGKKKLPIFRALSFWVGYKKTSVSYCVQDRTVGESKWSTKSLIKYALTNISSFSSAPLHIVTVLGFIMLGIAVVFGAVSLYQKFAGVALGGFTTVILLLLFSSSIIMICLGIMGYYLARIYDEIKGRPRFIVSKIVGGKDE